MELRDQIDADTYRSRLIEADFQHTIELTLKQLGYLTYHTHDSRRSDPGYPDVTAVGRGRLLHLEVKRAGGVPSVEQLVWLHRLTDNGFEAYLVFPKDWDDLLACLAGRPHGLTQGPRPDADWEAREHLKRAQRRRRRHPAGAARFLPSIVSAIRAGRRLLTGDRSAHRARPAYGAPAGRSPPDA